jgi:GT2 family glycosyltransferase
MIRRWFNLLFTVPAHIFRLGIRSIREPSVFVLSARRAWRIARQQGPAELFLLLLASAVWDRQYRRLLAEYERVTPEDLEAIARRIANFRRRPTISVLLPVYNAPEQWLRRAVESVREQIYGHWELCIADDASSAPHVVPLLEQLAAGDSRIRLTLRERNGHISEASNSALDLATGEFIALLDHDDELSPLALYLAAEEINRNPEVNLIYSDEDKIDARGVRSGAYFKPDWNPDLLRSQNYISHLGVYRASLAREVGGFRTGYEGCQDWDLALRVTERCNDRQIAHLPFVLYHWRTIQGSTAMGHEQKEYVTATGKRVLEEHLARQGLRGEPQLYIGGHFRVRYYAPEEEPRVSIIIPTRDRYDLLKQCTDSIFSKTAYRRFEILIVDNQTTDAAALELLETLRRDSQARVIRYDAPFNYSAINNHAVREASGDIVVLLNNDIEVISPTWLEDLVGLACRKGTGAAGGMLYYPDDTIQHAGVILGMGGVAGHAYLNSPRGSLGYFSRAALPQNLSAVTAACLAIRKRVYLEVGGMNEKELAVAFNDVDFCLRVQEAGYRNVWTPMVEMYHHESASRGVDDTAEKQARFASEVAYMKKRWGRLLDFDPAYNPNLSLSHPFPMLAKAPRTTKPWAAERGAGAAG